MGRDERPRSPPQRRGGAPGRAQPGPRGHPPVLAAALLHDVGKNECGLGTYGRVIATVSGAAIGRDADTIRAWTRTRGFTRRVGLYLQHPKLGGDLLGMAGSDPRHRSLDPRAPPPRGRVDRSPSPPAAALQATPTTICSAAGSGGRVEEADGLAGAGEGRGREAWALAGTGGEDGRGAGRVGRQLGVAGLDRLEEGDDGVGRVGLERSVLGVLGRARPRGCGRWRRRGWSAGSTRRAWSRGRSAPRCRCRSPPA